MIWVALLFVAAAAVCDLRSREIPNWIFVGLLVSAVVGTTTGLSPVTWTGLGLGAGIACVVMFPLYQLGAFGGGDLKVIVSLAAGLGPLGFLTVFAFIAIAGGLLALVALARGQRSLAYAPAIALGLLVYAIQTEVLGHATRL